jgi:hypothetical protein
MKNDPVVMRLIQEITSNGRECEFEDNPRGMDRMRCYYCGSYSLVAYIRGVAIHDPIDHHINCAFVLAQQIHDSMPEEPEGNKG